MHDKHELQHPMQQQALKPPPPSALKPAAFPSDSPFSATIPVQSAILPVTVPISPTKLASSYSPAGYSAASSSPAVPHPTTPKTYPPPPGLPLVQNGSNSSFKSSPFNGIKVSAPSATPLQAQSATAPHIQYPSPFTTPVKVPQNLVKSPPVTTPLSPTKPAAFKLSPVLTKPLTSPKHTISNNVSSPPRPTPFTLPISPTPASPTISSTSSYASPPYSPLRTSYSATTPPSPALSINTSPLAKSVPLSPADPSKKTHIVSGLVSDLRKQVKNNKRKPEESNSTKPARLRKKAAKTTVTPLTTTEEQTLLARLQMLGSDTSPAANRLKRKLTLREVARQNGREPFDIDARVTKMLETTTKSQQRISKIFSKEEIVNFTAQLKRKRALANQSTNSQNGHPSSPQPSKFQSNHPPQPLSSQPSLQSHTQTPSAIDMFTTNSVPPSSPPAVSTPLSAVSTAISTIPISSTLTSPATTVSTTPISANIIPPIPLPSIPPFASISPTTTFTARAHTFPTSISYSPITNQASNSSLMTSSPLTPSTPSNSSPTFSTPTTTTTTTTTMPSTEIFSDYNNSFTLDSNPLNKSDDNHVTSTNFINTNNTTINTINSVNNVSSNIVQQQKLQSIAQLKAVKDLPRSVQETPRTFRSLLEGEELHKGFGRPLVSPYTLRTLKPTPHHLRLLEELIANPRVVRARQASEENSDTADESSTKCPIDYVYFRPWLLPQVNTFLYFWPGIDVRECLEYPDFTVCALYRNMLVGCGFMTPDAYIIYIAVRSGWRDAGIATFMLYHLSQTIQGKDITLHVSATNPAMLLYQKFGFKPEEFIVDFYNQYYPDDSLECKHAYLLRLRR